MPTYKYQIKNAKGDVKAGMMQAESASGAAAVLRNQGGHVMSISQANANETGLSLYEKFKELNAGKPTARHILSFTTQLAVMIRAGINLRAALEGIGDQTDHAGFKKIINKLKADVESGKQFSEAIAQYPKLFGPLYVNMVRASELSGSFSDMLNRIADYLEQEIETRKMVIGASIYPGVIAAMAIGVTVFLLTFVLPKFGDVFKGKEDALPWATNFLMGVSDFMTESWMVIVGTVVGVVVALVLFLKTEVGGYAFDRFRLSVPVVRTMFKALYISRSLQTMGQLINAGVPMLDTVAITGDISGNRLYKNLWRSVYGSIKQGKKISQPLQKSPLLPKAVTQMISAGEESGKLGEVLDEISAFYQKQLKERIKAVTSMIEPLMIVIMGSIVGFIAMAVILPIFKMSQVVG